VTAKGKIGAGQSRNKQVDSPSRLTAHDPNRQQYHHNYDTFPCDLNRIWLDSSIP
jgi:hypothetical protein